MGIAGTFSAGIQEATRTGLDLEDPAWRLGRA